MQQQLGLADEELDELLQRCAGLLKSPKVSAAQLVNLCYSTSSLKGGSSSEESMTDDDTRPTMALRE